jgi:hypothetical protein
MKTNPLPKSDHMQRGKPVTTQQELLNVIDNGGVCKECLNEDFDSCVCPEPEN